MYVSTASMKVDSQAKYEWERYLMKLVHQTIIGGNDSIGNCFPACLASLLEIDISEVPHFLDIAQREAKDAMGLAREWLAHNFGLGLLTVHLPKEGEYHIAFQGSPNTLCIVAIPSPNVQGGCHAVIGKISSSGLSVEFVFDPRRDGNPCANENGYFLQEPYYFQCLIPLDDPRPR